MLLLAYLQPALFYLIPIVIGRSLYQLSVVVFQTDHEKSFRKFLKSIFARQKNHQEEKEVISRILNLGKYFVLGSIFLFGLAFLIKSVTNFLELQFSSYYFTMVYTLAILSACFSTWKKTNFSQSLFKQFGLILLFVIGFSLITTAIWKWRTPYQMNWDFYQHQTLATLILKQNSFDFFTSKMSDTFGFNSYPPFFHLLLATSQFGNDLSPKYILTFWESISFLHLLTVSLASYLLGFTVTKKRIVGVLSCLVGTLVFDSVISFTNLFFLPQTLCAVIFIWIFSKYIYSTDSDKKLSFVELVLSCVTLILMHYVVGALAASILILEWIYVRFHTQTTTLIKTLPIVQLGILLAIGAVIGSQFVNLSFLNNGEGEFYVFSILEKAEFAQRSYGFSLLFLIPIGIVASYQLLTKQLKFTLLITVGLISILVSQFPYVLKFYVIARFFIHLLMAIGLWGLINSLHFKWSKGVAILVTTTAFALILVSNVLFWKQGLFASDQFAHIDQDDLDAAVFLQQFDKNHTSTIISDPATQFILEGLSGVNSVAGVYGTESQREQLFHILALDTDQQTKSRIQAVFDPLQPQTKTKLLVLSGRSHIWANSPEKDRDSYNFNVWAPKVLSFSDLVQIQEVKESYKSFSLVYQNPSIAIFRLN